MFWAKTSDSQIEIEFENTDCNQIQKFAGFIQVLSHNLHLAQCLIIGPPGFVCNPDSLIELASDLQAQRGWFLPTIVYHPRFGHNHQSQTKVDSNLMKMGSNDFSWKAQITLLR